MLSEGNIERQQKRLLETAKNFNSFLLIVLSDHKKAFAIFIPHRFEKTGWGKPSTSFAFYWIND